MRGVLLMVGLVELLGSGCGPSVLVRYQVAPLIDLGDVTTVGVEAHGESSVQQQAAALITARLQQRLKEQATFKVSACAQRPCDEVQVWATAEVVEAAISMSETLTQKPEVESVGGNSGAPARERTKLATTVTLRVQVHFARGDGAEFASRDYGLTRHGSAANVSASTESLLSAAVDELVAVVVHDVTPLQNFVRLVLDADGPLKEGAELAGRGDLQAAAASFTRVLEAQGNLPGALYDLGVVAEGRSDFAGARGYYQRAIDASHQAPKYVHAMQALESNVNAQPAP
jgi:tetratricopeptide (TPR) repeat protein